jgi:phage gp37-like protein
MVTVPEEVTRYLQAVTARVRDVFGDHVVGVYTTGSLEAITARAAATST